MTIDLYTSAGDKKGTVELPKAIFEVPVRNGLIYQAVVRQQSNRRNPIAHAKTRGETKGSTRKLYAQKGTGRARRGPVRSPLLRGGGKTFGPRSNANFTKKMPKSMRREAIKSCLSLRASEKRIIAMENYPDKVKTKDMMALLKKLPVEVGRKIIFVTPDSNKPLYLASRNIPRVEIIMAGFLNPESILGAWNIVLVEGTIGKLEEYLLKSSQSS